MNRKLIDILINDEIISKEIKTYNKIVEFLNKDNVDYDGRVISLYELDKILKEKMNYIKELTDINNYVIDKYYLKEACYYSKVDKFHFRINIYSNSKKEVDLGFRIDFDDYIDALTFRYPNNDDIFNDRKIIYYRFFGMTIRSRNVEREAFYNKFINDNEEIISELLSNIYEYYDYFNRNIDLGKELIQLINLDDLNLRFIFDLNKKNYNLEILELNGYNSSNREDLLKKISINITDLNPFFRNEIDKYYNSINSIEYKYYKKERSL